MAGGLLKGSLHTISDSGEQGIELMFFLKGYSGAHMLFLPLTRQFSYCMCG